MRTLTAVLCLPGLLAAGPVLPQATAEETLRVATFQCDVTLPIGQISRLPIGVTLFGRPYTEPRLIGFAHALELQLEGWREPEFLPTLPAVVRPAAGD